MTQGTPITKRPVIARAFTDHPASVGETYFEHLWFASRFSGRLIAAGLAAFIHALIPAFFEKTAGNEIHAMHHDLTSRSPRHDNEAF